MQDQTPPTPRAGIESWPPGWPLPLIAMAPSLRWEDVVEFYVAYCESVWGQTAEPVTEEHRHPAPAIPRAA